jgi:hypothetical protein
VGAGAVVGAGAGAVVADVVAAGVPPHAASNGTISTTIKIQANWVRKRDFICVSSRDRIRTAQQQPPLDVVAPPQINQQSRRSQAHSLWIRNDQRL